jgi:hypothetical protein
VVRARVTLVAAFILTLQAGAPVDAVPRPTIVLVRTTPVQVRASGFGPHETVQVTVRSENIRHTTATAGPSGRFDTSVPGAVISRCHAFVITAARAHGSHAVLRRRPQCPVRTSG